MSWTTPAPARDVTALFPGIEEYALTATRLHPRRGTPDPHASHIGGPLRWPADEPWPACAATHLVPVEIPIPPALLARLKVSGSARDWPGYEAALAELASEIPGFSGINRRTGSALGYLARPEPEPSPFVAIGQLSVSDIAALRAPAGADLLQVLWCPHGHDSDNGVWAPAVTLRWRRADDVPAVLERPPPPAVEREVRYLPHPCVVHPEQVVEYPWWQELPAELGHQVRSWDDEHHGLYHRQLSTAPGWKVGGWSPWPTTDPVPLFCPRCGARMSQLLQIDSVEWGDQQRWRPLEERELHPGTAEFEAATEPIGIMVGRSGLCRIFYCPSCPDIPFRVNQQ